MGEGTQRMTDDRARQGMEALEVRFPELDEPALRRAAARMAAGAEPHAALAAESVMLQLVRAYN